MKKIIVSIVALLGLLSTTASATPTESGIAHMYELASTIPNENWSAKKMKAWKSARANTATITDPVLELASTIPDENWSTKQWKAWKEARVSFKEVSDPIAELASTIPDENWSTKQWKAWKEARASI